MIAEHNLWGRVRTIFADDVTMASLYKHAKFFVFSSEYEGFGLPVLESYKMGCIALLNDIEVFREITDGQGTFFNLKENESNLSEVAEKVVSLTNEEKNAILEKQYKILSSGNILYIIPIEWEGNAPEEGSKIWTDGTNIYYSSSTTNGEIKTKVEKYIGTAAGKDIPTSGDATDTQVVKGDDSRLHYLVIRSYDPDDYDERGDGKLWFTIPEE
jgi:hypothetical protein